VRKTKCGSFWPSLRSLTTYVCTERTDGRVIRCSGFFLTVYTAAKTHVVLVGVVSLLEGEDGGVDDAALLLQGVRLWGERQDGLVVGRQAGEAELGEVVDEEVELGGDAAQTGLYQPGEEEEEEGGGKKETWRFFQKAQ